MRRHKLFTSLLLIALVLGITPGSFAGFSNLAMEHPSRFEQRKLYLDLIDAIKNNRRTTYLENRDKLLGYPLYPYLEYTDKIYRLSRQSEEDISAFMTQYQDTPLANQLLQNWLFSLAKRNEWELFSQYYTEEDSTSENDCYFPYALHRLGRKEEAFEIAKQLWLVDRSQPDECDPIFKLWRDEGKLDASLAWQRFELAFNANEITLANYLKRFLSTEDVALADQYLAIRSNPKLVAQKRRFRNDTAKSRTLLRYGIERFARQDPEASLEIWEQYHQTFDFSSTEVAEIYLYIAIWLVKEEAPAQLLNDIPLNFTDHPELIEAQVISALRDLQWSQALVLLHVLEDQQNDDQDRWRYWRARILSGSEDQADVQQAESIYRLLARERSFYGFLAADHLGVAYNFEDDPVQISNEQVLSLEATPGIQRALELFALGEQTRARREWYFTLQNFSNIELQIAARVAEKWGWYDMAIRAMITARAWNDLSPRFPLAYYDTFIKGARTADIPLNWSMAIARQESAFMPDARSSAGALGIMQLMPDTARYVARVTGKSAPSEWELTNPETNISLGSAYLGQMLRRFDGNRIIASAAYNAGPSRVQRWLDPEIPLDVWIETIPFSETRKYVQNVLMFAAIYGRALNRPQSMIYPHERAAFSTQVTQTNRAKNDNS